MRGERYHENPPLLQDAGVIVAFIVVGLVSLTWYLAHSRYLLTNRQCAEFLCYLTILAIAIGCGRRSLAGRRVEGRLVDREVHLRNFAGGLQLVVEPPGFRPDKQVRRGVGLGRFNENFVLAPLDFERLAAGCNPHHGLGELSTTL